MSNITKTFNVYKDMTYTIGMRSFGKKDLVKSFKGQPEDATISRNDMQNYVLDGIDVQPVMGDNKAVIDFSNVRLPWKFEYSDKMLTSRFAIAPYGTTVTQQRYEKELNATIIGSPTITEDFIVSGFNSSNYLSLMIDIDISQPFEIYVTAKASSTGSNRVIISNQTSGASFFRFDSTNLKSWSSSGNGGTYVVSANVEYNIKGVSDGTTWYLYGKNSNESDWTLSWSCPITWMFVNGSNQLIFGRNTSTYTSQYFVGNIDFKECSIKKNGVEVWKGVDWIAKEEMETLQGCVRYYFGYKPDATTPPEDSTNTYNIYAVNGDEGVVLDSKWYDYGGLTTRPVLGDGPVPTFENEWYLGEYRVETGEEGSPYSPDGGYFPGGGIVLT